MIFLCSEDRLGLAVGKPLAISNFLLTAHGQVLDKSQVLCPSLPVETKWRSLTEPERAQAWLRFANGRTSELEKMKVLRPHASLIFPAGSFHEVAAKQFLEAHSQPYFGGIVSLDLFRYGTCRKCGGPASVPGLEGSYCPIDGWQFDFEVHNELPRKSRKSTRR